MKIKKGLEKIKIRQRFVNLKEKIKKLQTKKIIIFTIVGGGLLFYPLSGAKALEETTKSVEAAGLDKTSFLNKAGHKVKIGVLMITGLKVCMDPTAPPLRKAIARAKLVGCGGYAGANIISSVASFPPQTKIISAACCTVSWAALTGLEYIDAKGN